MQEHGLHPRARQRRLVVQQLGEESLVYDRDTDVAHCLGSAAARVWRACDGSHDLAEIAALVSETPELVGDAIDELREKGLLETSASLPDRAPGVSRRQALGRMAKIGAGAAAAPLIVSAMAASPASAASNVGLLSPCGASSPTADTCAPQFVCAVNPSQPAVRLCYVPSGGTCVANIECAGNVCTGGTCA